MNETNQKYVFDTQSKLDDALSHLAVFEQGLYRIIEAGHFADLITSEIFFVADIWFADLETVCIPWCAIVFPEPTE